MTPTNEQTRAQLARPQSSKAGNSSTA